jgi:hypothetical protein
MRNDQILWIFHMDPPQIWLELCPYTTGDSGRLPFALFYGKELLKHPI